MKVKSESEVAQSCPTLSDPLDCSLPGSSVHGIFQARVQEWGAIAFSEKMLTLLQIFHLLRSCASPEIQGLASVTLSPFTKEKVLGQELPLPGAWNSLT